MFVAVLILSVRHWWPYIFTDDEGVAKVVTSLLVIVAVLHVCTFCTLFKTNYTRYTGNRRDNSGRCRSIARLRHAKDRGGNQFICVLRDWSARRYHTRFSFRHWYRWPVVR